MVMLAVESSTGSQLVYDVRKRSITVGAASGNDVVLRAPGVAPRHLLIQQNGDQFTFVTQNRQLVVLNGERRSRGVLRVGDRLKIGTATLVFRGVREDLEADESAAPAPEEGPRRPEAAPAVRPRGTALVYREPQPLAEVRRELGELFRVGARSDLVPSLQAFFERAFPEASAMLAWVDEERRLQPIVSTWTGDPPKVPARVLDELWGAGRYAELDAGGLTVLVQPVQDPVSGVPRAFLLLGLDHAPGEPERVALAETALVLGVQWARIESSSELYSRWEENAARVVEEEIPGTSTAVRILRANLVVAAAGREPVLVAGRPGSGRTFAASLLARIHPTGALPVTVFQGRDGDEAALRRELFGEGGEGGAVRAARGGVLVVREVHELPVGVQREIAAAIHGSAGEGVAAGVRWVFTTAEDVLAMVNAGRLEPALFSLASNHLLAVPSLGERREDLPLLVVRLLERVSAEQGKRVRGIELETLNGLLARPWAGEMTELVGEIGRLVSATPEGEMVRGGVETFAPAGVGAPGDEADPARILDSDDLKEVIPAVERLLIDRVLRRVMGNQSKAARILNISRGALIAKIKEYGIPDYRHLRRRRG